MRSDILDADGCIRSDVWVDQPHFEQLLEMRLKAELLSNHEAELIWHFANEGYCIVDLELGFDLTQSAVKEAEDVFAQRPAALLCAATSQNNGRPMPLANFPCDFGFAPGVRLLDAHSHVESFARLMAAEKIHRLVALILNATPVATQSLYFPYGSLQNIHRDPWFVVTTPISSMIAAWIALEDIDPESGPLSYVPKSHRLPYNPLPSGDIIFHGRGITVEDRKAHINDMWRRIRETGLEVRRFTPKRGQALIWHSSLAHGGSEVLDKNKTRNSFVIHFDALKNHPKHAQSVVIEGGVSTVISTSSLRHSNGRIWFENPLV